MVAVAAWGFAPLLVRGIDADASVIIFWRVLLALPISIGVAYATGGGMSWDMMRRALLTGICFAVSIMAGFSSFRATSIANATLIPALQPALILVLASRMFGVRRSRGEVIWALVAFAGVSAVVLGASGGSATLHGNLLAVANLLVFTGYFLSAKRARTGNVHSWSFLASVFVVTACVVSPWSIAVNGGVETVHGTDWLLVLAIVLGPGMIGHGFMTWAHHYVDVGVTSMLTLANPVVSIVGAWLIFSQGLAVVQVLGTVTVLVALGMIVRHQRGPRAVAAEAALSGDLLEEAPVLAPDGARDRPPTESRRDSGR